MHLGSCNVDFHWRVMLAETPSTMLQAARGVASRIRHRTASWGCAKLATACPTYPQPPCALPCYRICSPNSTYTCHQRHSLTTFAALSTRESNVMLDPGDYEAGQIQVSPY